LRTYAVYGLRLASEWVLPGYLEDSGGPGDVVLRRGTGAELQAPASPPTADAWPLYQPRPDGWGDAFEFLIAADGREVLALVHDGASLESFHTYLLGQVLSFVLIQRGMEPLHATAVETPCGAVAFLGASGAGKSTLASGFVAEGNAVLTDDLLVIHPGEMEPLVHPGPPRLKLFPDTAKAIGPDVPGTPMNPLSEKLVIPLGTQAFGSRPRPLRAVYLLRARPDDAAGRILVRPLEGPAAFRALMASTYNNYVESPSRLRSQFQLLSGLISRVPIRLLSYPRRFESMPRVRRRVLADACRPA
jgi:hypothetical protein